MTGGRDLSGLVRDTRVRRQRCRDHGIEALREKNVDREITARLREKISSKRGEKFKQPIGRRFVDEILVVRLYVIDPAAQIDSCNPGLLQSLLGGLDPDVIEEEVRCEVAA